MPRSPDRNTIIRLATAQHGVVSRAQLRQEGIPRHTIDRRVRGGFLQRLQVGVYLVGITEPPLAREMAACLACGPHAFLSHRSAAVVWKILPTGARPRRVDISLRSGCRRRPGVRTYRPESLSPDETTIHDRLPITSAARTLLDLAEQLRRRPLDRAVARAIALRLTDPKSLGALVDRHATKRGAGRLKAVLQGGGPAFTRSEAEVRFLELVRRAKVDPPEVNTRLVGLEVDFYWPTRGLAVEVDGKAYHSAPRDFERDRQRDSELAAIGVRVVRVTWRQMNESPEALLVRLGAALSAGDRRLVEPSPSPRSH